MKPTEAKTEMSDEPTPRTDAVRLPINSHRFKEDVVFASFARELERELAAKAHALELSNTAYGQMFREREELERENARLNRLMHDLGIALKSASLRDTPATAVMMAQQDTAICRHENDRLRTAPAGPETKQRAG